MRPYWIKTGSSPVTKGDKIFYTVILLTVGWLLPIVNLLLLAVVWVDPNDTDRDRK